ncbi:MAG: cob(I)yrinic acid a,c-diamide adenosyltransferase [Phycisphaerae bacterium]|nr:cob(I)yrinic acid a,c-diamide adenosyltransferase [Phycisphaerae bacterium]
MLERGLVQVYTGNGKGKTTAALGLALRAAGQGLRVRMVQFLKPPCLALGERKALAGHELPIQLEALDVEWDMASSPSDPDARARAQTAISAALAGLRAQARSWDVLILDEIVFCLAQGLARFEDVRGLIQDRPPWVEIVMTGRGATPELVDLADLVTEMQDLKHPMHEGLGARPGMEY